MGLNSQSLYGQDMVRLDKHSRRVTYGRLGGRASGSADAFSDPSLAASAL